MQGFDDNNQLTPKSILTLFIVSVLAGAWAIATAVRLNSTRRSALFVAFIDLCFVGAFIASVYELRSIDDANCKNFRASRIYLNIGPFGYYGEQAGSKWARDITKNCRMLTAAWAFGIMNTIMFFFTAILAVFLHRNERAVVVKEVRRSRHSSRRGHSRSGSSRRSGSGRRSYYV